MIKLVYRPFNLFHKEKFCRRLSLKNFFSVFVAMSTFGAVNGILLTSSRLFYAGAIEGQMPEILTMIQIQRLTPAPAVLAISVVTFFF